MTAIQKPSAAQIKRWRALSHRADRLEQGLFLAEGEHLVIEALQAGKALALLCAEDRLERFAAYLDQRDIPVYALNARALQQLSDTRAPQGIFALCALPENAALPALGPRMVALEQVQDPGNVGSILRSMDAAGFSGLLTDTQSADAFSDKALRASMGAVFRIPIRLSEDLAADLRALEGHTLIAGSLLGSPFYERPPVTGPLCLMIGNEGAGLSEGLQALADMRLRLPMPGGAESLNAAVAAGIMIYDFVRSGELPPAR